MNLVEENNALSRNEGKVAIVGAGRVGSSAAYAMMLDGVASHVTLIDINAQKAEGEALDLAHGMQFTRSTKIEGGDSFELVSDAVVVVVCAGVAQKAGEKRTDLLKKNCEVFDQIIPQIVKYNKDAILLIITNPVDVLTYRAWKLSGFDSCRVFSSGTVLDTARLRYLLGEYFSVSPKDIVAYVLGEHGDSEFVWWSKATIGGIALNKFKKYSFFVLNEIYEKVKNAAYYVIEKKGATNYAIGLVIAKIVRAILLDQSRVFTVSNVLQDYKGVSEVALSIPTIIRRAGICQRLDIELNKEELDKFHASAQKIAGLIKVASKY